MEEHIRVGINWCWNLVAQKLFTEEDLLITSCVVIIIKFLIAKKNVVNEVNNDFGYVQVFKVEHDMKQIT